MAQVTDPSSRVMVFVDGQNAYKRCEEVFRHGACHPLLIADHLAGSRKLVGVRYYSGVHDPNIDPRSRSRSDRRHHLMRRCGITVVERQLRYRWEWGFDDRKLPDLNPRQAGFDASRVKSKSVSVRPYQRAREKGIDLAIGLDVMDLALDGYMDVAVIVSSDTDICEAARATHEASLRAGSRVSVEAAVFTTAKRPNMMKHYDFTHQLGRSEFNLAEDNFDYSKELDKKMVGLFAASCATMRKHFP